ETPATTLSLRTVNPTPHKRLPPPTPAPVRASHAPRSNLIPTMTALEFAAARAALGETQEALAHRRGVHVRTVRRWELGERTMSRKAVLQVRVLANGLPQLSDVT